jgi:hypothetical protein
MKSAENQYTREILDTLFCCLEDCCSTETANSLRASYVSILLLMKALQNQNYAKEDKKSTDLAPSKNSYERYKEKINKIIEKSKKFDQKKPPAKVQPQQMVKSILYDRYVYNRARAVTSKDGVITQYKVSISFRGYKKAFWINFKGRWRKMVDVFNELKKEGLVLGKGNIISILRDNNKKIWGRQNDRSPHRRSSYRTMGEYEKQSN